MLKIVIFLIVIAVELGCSTQAHKATPTNNAEFSPPSNPEAMPTSSPEALPTAQPVVESVPKPEFSPPLQAENATQSCDSIGNVKVPDFSLMTKSITTHKLWNDSEDKSEQDVKITIYRPKNPNGKALVIMPGGAYLLLAVRPEGHLIAEWLNANDITGIVLEYRLPNGNYEIPLRDAKRAIRTVRSMASDLKLDINQVGVIGFSAGGHLASTISTQFDLGVMGGQDSIENFSSRPDFAILVYPVISMGPKGHDLSRSSLLGLEPSNSLIERFSSEKNVTANTPPFFLAHAVDDRAVSIENSRIMHAALTAKGIESTLLELPFGDHGLCSYRGPTWDKWQTSAIAWMARPKP